MCYGNILEASMRHARKAHRCAFCKDPINPGDPYESMTFVGDDGELGTQKQCLRCAAQLRAVDRDSTDGGCIYDWRETLRAQVEGDGWKKFRAKVREKTAELVAKLKPRRRSAGGGA